MFEEGVPESGEVVLGTTPPATLDAATLGAASPDAATLRAFALLAAAASASPSWGEQHPVAARLSYMDPDAHLARILSSVEVTDVDDAALVETVAAWERVASWVASRQADAVAEMVRRAGPSRGEDFVADEVAVRLAISRKAATVKVALAEDLREAPAVHDALDRGSIDVAKARVLTTRTAHLEPSTSRRRVDAVLPDADSLTAPQLRARLRRIELNLDPAAAERHHCAAAAERSIRLTPAPDAMAWLTAYLPADDAMRVMTAVDAVAGSCAPGDTRPMDARRADALVDVMAAVLDSGVGPGGPLPTRHGSRPHIQVTVSETTLAGTDDRPGTLAGYGPVPASMARRIACGGTWRALLTDARTGEGLAWSSKSYRPSRALARLILNRDVTCTFPGCRAPAEYCDLDHLDPFDPSRPPEEQTTDENLHALCRHHHRLKTHGGWKPSRDPVTGVTTWESRTGHVYRRDPVRADQGEVPRSSPAPTTGEPTRDSGDARDGSGSPEADDAEPPPF